MVYPWPPRGADTGYEHYLISAENPCDIDPKSDNLAVSNLSCVEKRQPF